MAKMIVVVGQISGRTGRPILVRYIRRFGHYFMGSSMSKLKLCHETDRTSGFKVHVTRDSAPVGHGQVAVSADELLLHLFQRGENLSWPIRSIRRYGREDGYFTFEAGRRCLSGPGFFAFKSKYSDRIFDLVRERVNAIAEADKAARNLAVPNCPQVPVPSLPTLITGSPQYMNVDDSQCNRCPYINCDSAGRYIGGYLTADERQDVCTLSARGSVSYVQLDVERFGEVDSADLGKENAVTSNLSRTVVSAFGSRQNGKGAGEWFDTRRFEGTSYVAIDPKRTKAAALLKRSG